MNPSSFHLINLGCAKNLVEGEHLAGALLAMGMSAREHLEDAEIIIINTCGFIQTAIEESLQVIMEAAQQKGPEQRLVVAGCLVGRFGHKLGRALGEADMLVGPGEMARLPQLLGQEWQARVHISRPRGIFTHEDPRALSTGPGWAYLRISDGCNRRCSFCTIPAIRGSLRSRKKEDILAEARSLAQGGVKEINLVGQDLTGYGEDWGKGPRLKELLNELDRINDLTWIRLLYLHPDYLEPDLLQTIASLERVVPYLDIPMQHSEDQVLEKMGRRRSGAELRSLVKTIREVVPQAILRTTIMVGHPGEGEAQFSRLLEFMEETQFDHLGCFAYSAENGTKSARMEAPSKAIGQKRRRQVMKLQKKISRQKLARLKGSLQEVLVLGPHPDSELVWQGRMASQAPEDDGSVVIVEGSAQPGTMAMAKIQRFHDYDVVAKLVG